MKFKHRNNQTSHSLLSPSKNTFLLQTIEPFIPKVDQHV